MNFSPPRPSRRPFWPALFLALALGPAPLVTAGLAPDAPNSRVIVVPTDAKLIQVAVTGSPAELGALMQRAFQAHGAFAVGAGGKTDYTFRFEQTGPTSVAVSVEPAAGGARFRLEASGPTWRQAAYRAGDQVVQRLTGNPGFFGGKLVFVSQRSGAREVWSSDVFGQEITQLTNNRSESIHPRWSPDGRKILYTGYYRSGFPDIVLLDLATGSVNNRFAAYKGTNTGAVFSPDGARVAMILSATGSPELYVSGADGRNPKRLTNTPTTLEASPAWSPDGARLVYSGDPNGSPQLFLIPAAGGAPTRVRTNLSTYCTEPSWNPRNPDLLAFTAGVGGGFQIATYNLKTGAGKILTSGPGSGLEPCWANDGVHIIFTRRQSNGREQLAIVNADNSREGLLTTREAAQADFVYPGQ